MKKSILLKSKRKRQNTALVKVSDDWCPNLPDDYVEMFYCPKAQHISIWGDDDFGMEKCGATEKEFKKLKNMVLSQDICKKMGFVLC